MRLIILLLAALAVSAVCAADWPRFLGPNGNGIAPDTGINKNWTQKPPKELWKIDLTDNGYAGPAVANGKVIILDHQEKKDILRVIDLNTGQENGRFSYDEPSGENYGHARCTPLVAGGRIYTVSFSGIVLCLDWKTGKELWRRHMVKDFGGTLPGWGYSWSMIVDDGKLIVQPGGPNAAVAALNPATGATIWAGGGSDKAGYATPVVATLAGKEQYLIFSAGGLMGINPANGQRLWQFPWKTSYDVNAATPIVIGNSVFITTGYGHGSALVNVTGAGAAQAWANTAVQSKFSTPVYVGGVAYSTSESGQLICFDPKNGAVKWQKGGFGLGAVCAADGVIIAVGGDSGDVVMIDQDAGAYKELGRIKPLGGQSWTAPVIANGKLLIRNKKALVCLDLK
jgi:outer membrane protein assembly factor BamB